jgi:hypothetical protein
MPTSKTIIEILLFVHDFETKSPLYPTVYAICVRLPCVILCVQHLCCVRHFRGAVTYACLMVEMVYGKCFIQVPLARQ